MKAKLLLTLLALLVLSTFCSRALAVCDIFQGSNGKYCIQNEKLYYIEKTRPLKITVYIPIDFPEYFEIQLMQTLDSLEVFGLLCEIQLQRNRNRCKYIGILKLFQDKTLVIPLPQPFYGEVVRNQFPYQISGSKIIQIIHFIGSEFDYQTEHFLWLEFDKQLSARIRALQGPFYKFH
jgi:hypothetical protein